MSETIIPRELSSRERPSTGRFDAYARRLVLKRLNALTGGRIVVRDGIGTVSAGATDESVTLRAVVTVHDPRFYRRLLLGGPLAAAEAYIDGLWSCDDLTALLRIFVRNMPLTHEMDRGLAKLRAPIRRALHWLRRNTQAGSRRNIHAHYDLGNDFFQLMLDDTMTYSCAIFENPETSLDEASIAKLDRLCRKLDLRADHRVLEIGTGWGSFAMHAAKHYGCRVTTTTISREQHEFATERIAEAGLADRITVLLADYRELSGRFDRIVSIEMIEAVGHAYLETFFETCSRLVEPDGLMALQAITMPEQRYDVYRRSVDFIQRYVFPGSCCPSIGAMQEAIGRATDMRIVHLEDIGPHYATTLRRWRENFEAGLDAVRAMGYGERFIRLWQYYLCYCEAGFVERYIGDIQITLAKPGNRREPILAGIASVEDHAAEAVR